MSPRRRRLNRRQQNRRRRRVALQSPAPIAVRATPSDTGIKVGISAFALGAAMALHEGHGELPHENFERPNPTGHFVIEAMVSSTSSLTSTTAFSSTFGSLRPFGSVGQFRFK